MSIDYQHPNSPYRFHETVKCKVCEEWFEDSDMEEWEYDYYAAPTGTCQWCWAAMKKRKESADA